MRKTDPMIKKFYSSEEKISFSKTELFMNEKVQETISKKEIRKHVKYFALICISVFLIGFLPKLFEFIFMFWVFLFIYNLQK